VLQASLNGYFFTLDRLTGEHLVSSKFGESANWAKGINAKGQPARDPTKDFDAGGALVSPANQGVTNWPPPAYSPDTGLMYVPTVDSYAMYYLTETDPRGAMGLGGKEELALGTTQSYISAIDYKTGKTSGSTYPTLGGGLGAGMLTTAGCCSPAMSQAICGHDAGNGKPLWRVIRQQYQNALGDVRRMRNNMLGRRRCSIRHAGEVAHMKLPRQRVVDMRALAQTAHRAHMAARANATRLEAITRQNVNRLQVAWTYDRPTVPLLRRLSPSP
jgi:hypothetical protein